MVKCKEKQENISFRSVPEWLRRSPDYQPWESGKKEIWKQINKLYSDAAPKVYDSTPGEISEDDSLAVRLLVCWLYHWKTAGTDKKGADVIKSVAEGRGFLRNGQLGGNPFFDLVHVQALCCLQNKAASLLQKDHLPYLRQAAKRVEGCARFDDEIPCWWGPFYMALTGTASEKAKATALAFKGYSGLRSWLRIALNLFLRRFAAKEAGREINESALSNSSDGERETGFSRMAAPESNGAAEPEWASVRKRFLLVLKQARSRLSDDEWARLYYHFGAKLQNQQIARLYNENGSTTTRRRDAALLKFRSGMNAAIADDPVLRDLGDTIFSVWGKEIGSLMQIFFEGKGKEKF